MGTAVYLKCAGSEASVDTGGGTTPRPGLELLTRFCTFCAAVVIDGDRVNTWAATWLGVEGA